MTAIKSMELIQKIEKLKEIIKEEQSLILRTAKVLSEYDCSLDELINDLKQREATEQTVKKAEDNIKEFFGALDEKINKFNYEEEND